MGVRVIAVDAPAALLERPANYATLIDRIGADVRVRLASPSKCRTFPSAIQLIDFLDVDGLEELSAHLVPQVERTIYESYASVDKVYVYRSLVTPRPPESSMLWHFDEHPKEMLKIMIYLSDVDEGSGPFTYLASPRPANAVNGARNPIGGHSRVSEVRIANYVASGCEIRHVTGPRGTMILFHDNAIHRGLPPTQSHRDVVVLQLRPSCVRQRPYIDPRWTGSFQHEGVNFDPWVITPQLEPAS